MLRIFLVSFLLFNTNVFAEDLKKVYFGGGCFWCMEESFDKAEGVKDVISGYSGGTTKNPTYKEVTYGNTGHFEVVEIVYDSKITNFENLLNVFWKNIDPFDKAGQFCDKGYSYRSVAFYQNQEQKKLIEKRIKEIELQYNKSVVTYGNTGHFEVVEIVYDSKITNFENLLNIFWKNIDPFDKAGQFCDKGYSYRSVAFYQNQEQKKLIEKRIKEIELQYNLSLIHI